MAGVDPLYNIRRRLKTKQKQLRKLADAVESGISGVWQEGKSPADMYRKQAESLDEAINRTYAKNISKASKSSEEYKEAKQATLKQLQRTEKALRTSTISEKNKLLSAEEIANQEILAQSDYKYAIREIMVYTYSKVWQGEDSLDVRATKIRAEVEKDLGVQGVTTRQILDWYESKIRESIKGKYGEKVASQYELATDEMHQLEIMNRLGGALFTETGSPITVNIESMYSQYRG